MLVKSYYLHLLQKCTVWRQKCTLTLPQSGGLLWPCLCFEVRFCFLCRILRRLQNAPNIDSRLSLENRLLSVNEELKKSHQEEVTRREKDVVEKVKCNPKAFYSYANSKRKGKPKIGPLRVNGEEVTGNKKIADTLGCHFQSVFSNPMPFVEEQPDTTCPTLENIEVTPTDIVSAIRTLNLNSSPGPDGVPALFLSKCQKSISPFLAKLFSLSIECGQLPKMMKLAFVTPIFKGGDKGDPACYRPVSVTSNVCKVWEKVKISKILLFLSENNLLPEHQHGFTNSFSTLTQLVEHFQDISEALSHKDSVDVILLDFAKCFDKIDFNLLLIRLHSLGIRGKVLEWIRGPWLNTVTHFWLFTVMRLEIAQGP